MKYLIKTQPSLTSRPLLDLLLTDSTGKRHKIEALIDTGFTGYICFNKKIADIFQMQYLGKSITRNADNQDFISLTVQAKVELPSLDIEHTKFLVKSICKENQDEEAIVGMQFLEKICIQNNILFAIDFVNKEVFFQNLKKS